MQFTQEELKNILALINLAQIKAADATTVAILQQKIFKMIEPEKPEKPVEIEKEVEVSEE